MIAKITRGSRVGDIAAYLHGPGKANEHRYEGRSGGTVIGGNLGREGNTDGAGWARDLRAAKNTRPEIKNAIWQTSLRTAPGDRTLSDQEWADAGQTFAEKMGFDQHPWAMVRHGKDHVHIVTSRVSETGEVWHARQDFRQAQSAAKQLEQEYGLTEAPRVREQAQRRTPAQERAGHRTSVTRVAGERAKAKKSLAVKRRAEIAAPVPPNQGLAAALKNPQRPSDVQAQLDAARQRAQESDRDKDRGYGR